MSLRLPIVLFAIVLASVAAFWWLIGKPVEMPPSPLAAGEKIPCVSYAPFRRGQSPFTEDIIIPASQIDDDFAHLSTVTDCVRIYAVDQGLENVPALARKHNLKVILGLWIGRSAVSNAKQIETAVQLANDNTDVVRLLTIGNETLLRGEISENDLGAILRSVKARVTVPTTYADVWEFWIKHRALADFVDVVTVHILPYWEDEPVPSELAGAHIADIRRHVGNAFPGKDILIGETGWPSEGRMRWGASATPSDQARAMHDILALQKKFGFDINLIEAFDQPWKRLLEGTVGGYWGLLDADTREPKFHWGEAVSNYPHWPWQAVLGTVMAGLVFGSAYVSGKGRHVDTMRWLAVAITAAVAGCTIGLAVHMHAIGVRTLFELGRAVLYLVLTSAAPIIAAAAMVRGTAPAAFTQILGSSEADASRLGIWLGWTLVATVVLAVFLALGLVFDPRYREFATSTVLGPIAGLALASLLAQQAARRLSERVFAAVLTASAIAMVIQERVSNWESLLFAATLIILAGTLAQARAVREPGAAMPTPAR